MIRINLLPQDEQKRSMDFKMPELGAFVPVAIAAVAIVACLGTFFVQNHSFKQLEQEVEVAREESRKLAPQIARIKQLERQRAQLDQRLTAISTLDRERYFRVHLMSEISRRLPKNSWLTRFEEITPGKFEIDGISFNNFIVADLLRDLPKSDYYDTVELSRTERGYIKSDNKDIDDVRVMKFSISANVSQPPLAVSAGL